MIFKFSLPDKKDFLILFVAIIITVVSSDGILSKLIQKETAFNTIQLLGSILLYMSIVNSPMGIRFSNFYFSLIWLLLGIIFYTNSAGKITFLPILGFTIYQVFRMIYWIFKKQEPIPNFISRSGFNFRFSKTVNRKADNSDFLFSMLLFVLGMAIMTIYMIFVVRK